MFQNLESENAMKTRNKIIGLDTFLAIKLAGEDVKI